MVTVAFILLLLLAVLLWAAAVGNLATMHHKDACGRGMAETFAVLALGAVWLIMAILLAMACLRRGIELGPACMLAALHVLSGICTISATFLLRGRASWLARWPGAYPALLPPLIFAWCGWVYFSSSGIQLEMRTISGATWGLIAAMTMAFAIRAADSRIRAPQAAN